MIGNLKGNAALLAAFSFNALTNGKPILDSTGAPADPNLQNAFVLLTCTTLALELVAVYVGQQLLYRMGDGNFAQVRDDGTNDPDRTILSILLSAKYGREMRTYPGRSNSLSSFLTSCAWIRSDRSASMPSNACE